jgi:hypothetical protein
LHSDVYYSLPRSYYMTIVIIGVGERRGTMFVTLGLAAP